MYNVRFHLLTHFAAATMTISELEALISGGESPQVELKLSTGQRSDGAKTACAMLNGSGGHVLFGVETRGGFAA